MQSRRQTYACGKCGMVLPTPGDVIYHIATWHLGYNVTPPCPFITDIWLATSVAYEARTPDPVVQN